MQEIHSINIGKLKTIEIATRLQSNIYFPFILYSNLLNFVKTVFYHAFGSVRLRLVR